MSGSSLSNGVWVAPTNTKVPAESHVYSAAVTLNSAGAQTVNLLKPAADSNTFVCTKVVFRGFSTTLLAMTATLDSGGVSGGIIALNTTFQTATTANVYVYTAKAGAVVTKPGDQIALTTVAGPAANSSGVIDIFGYWVQGV